MQKKKVSFISFPENIHALIVIFFYESVIYNLCNMRLTLYVCIANSYDAIKNHREKNCHVDCSNLEEHARAYQYQISADDIRSKKTLAIHHCWSAGLYCVDKEIPLLNCEQNKKLWQHKECLSR